MGVDFVETALSIATGAVCKVGTCVGNAVRVDLGVVIFSPFLELCGWYSESESSSKSACNVDFFLGCVDFLTLESSLSDKHGEGVGAV